MGFFTSGANARIGYAGTFGGLSGLVGLMFLGVQGCGETIDDFPPENRIDSGTDATDGNVQDAPTDGQTDGPEAPPLVYAFVGHSSEGWIQVYEVAANGTWTFKSKTEMLGAPNWIDVDVAHNHVFATNGSNDTVRSFTFNPATAALTVVNDRPSGGDGPAHLSIDRSGKWLFVANYNAGTNAVFPVAGDATIGAAADTNTSGDESHWAGSNPSGGFVFVPCVAPNLIARYSIDSMTGAMTALPIFNAGVNGPRHLAFHPTEKFVYAVNEPAGSISAMTFDKTTGALGAIETKTTLPAGFTDPNTGAEIVMHPSGKFVYTSNRGHDSIAAFSINATDGKLTSIGHLTTGGRTPRSFDITPDGKYLYVGNQAGPKNVRGMSIDQTTGMLTSIGDMVSTGNPTVIRVFAFPR